MLVTVTSADQPEALRSLRDWLHDEPRLRGTRVAQVPRPPGTAEMGALADTLSVISDNGTVLAAVAATVGTWLTTRHRTTRIRVRDGDREVEIESGSIKGAQQIAEQIVAALDKDGE